MTEEELAGAYGLAGIPGPEEAMTEAELLAGITEALTFGGWRWTHIRRSDGVTVGHSGLPDIIAVHPTRGIVLTWELKAQRGDLTQDQAAWIGGMRRATRLDARVVRPDTYDDALRVILNPAPSIVSPG